MLTADQSRDAEKLALRLRIRRPQLLASRALRVGGLRAGSRILRRWASTATVLLSTGHGHAGDRAPDDRYHRMTYSSLSALTSLAIAPRAAESEASMQVTRSWAKKIRKWLGLDKKSPDKVPYGAGVERS
jgi:hypothetical protein